MARRLFKKYFAYEYDTVKLEAILYFGIIRREGVGTNHAKSNAHCEP